MRVGSHWVKQIKGSSYDDVGKGSLLRGNFITIGRNHYLF